MALDLSRFEAHGTAHGTAAVVGDVVRLRAGPRTDWFFKPDGGGRRADVVSLEAPIDAPVFALSARVRVDFASAFDAGALFVACDDDHWAKIAFERSAGGVPTIVSVVTRGTSDDADGPAHDAAEAWLRLYCDGTVVAFHYSDDGRHWRFVRLFTLRGIGARPVRIGFGAQSPTGEGTLALFSDVALRFDPIADLRDGS